jgi:hypothetical protein
LTLSNPVGALLDSPGTTVLTIADSDMAGTMALSNVTYSVAGNGLATISADRRVALPWATRPAIPEGRCDATAGADYDPASGDLHFGSNETTNTFIVQRHGITGNTVVTLALSSAFLGVALGKLSIAALWVVDGS